MPRKKAPKIDERTERNLIVQSSEKISSPLEMFKKPSSRILIGLLLIVGLLYYFKGLFVAAIVNGQPISRFSILQEAEKQTGGQVLNSYITKILILQEAKKQGISIDKKEIDTEIKKLEDNVSKQGQNLDTLLVGQGMSRSDLAEQIKLQKIIEKMLAKDIKITNKEIDEFMEKNKDSLEDRESSEKARESVKQQLTQQKLSEKFRTFLEDLQKKAKIYYFVNY